jgi:hypothetical protein
MQARREDRNESRTDQKVANLHLVCGSTQEDSSYTGPMPEGIPFRLVADFVVEVNPAEPFFGNSNLTAYERSFLTTILSIPEAFNRMCRLAIVCELEADLGLFEDQFWGPQSEVPWFAETC